MTDQTKALAALPTMSEALSSPESYKRAQLQWSEIVATNVLPAAIKSPMQAMAIIETGRSMGLDTWESLRGLQMVQGTPCLKAAALGGLLRKRFGQDCYVVLRSDDEVCEIKVKVRDPETGEFAYPMVRFSASDAKRAGLGNLHNKYPASMLFARAITRVEKRYHPIGGGSEIWVQELVEPKAAPTTLGEV